MSIKKFILSVSKRFVKLVFRKVKKIKFEIQLVRIAPIIRRMQKTPDFPASDGSALQHLELTLRGNMETISLLNRLFDVSSLEIVTVNGIATGSSIEEKMLELLDENGSDKGSAHEYFPIYSRVFDSSAEPLHILEIGLGSKNKRIPSNMGKYGSPGASLRAFRDIRPGNKIYGADIDMDTLNLESDFEYIHLDQTDDASWQNLLAQVPHHSLDLLIDDGLHSPVANLRTLIYGPRLMKPGGVIVIEDIAEKAIPVWSLAAAITENLYNFELYQCKKSYALVIAANQR